MRRVRVIACATAIEILSEPLCLLITLSALALVSLAPAIHYHQFGEATRMARDAGFSALLLGGIAYASFCAHKTLTREVESGTMQTALAHSVSRTCFFLAKVLGCVCAYLIFACTIGAVSLTVVNGADIGGRVAAAKCDIARMWGPSLSWALAAVAVPLGAAAALNRFARFRFVLTAQLLAVLMACVGVLYRFQPALAGRIAPALVLFACPPLVMLVASAAFAARFRSNVSASLTVATALCLIPMLGNYCLSDALSRGGVIPLNYFGWALLALLPLVLAFLALGVKLINGKGEA